MISMNPTVNKRFTIKRKKKYTKSELDRCEITIKFTNSRGEHEAEHKTMEIQTYIHAFINRKLHNCYILFLSHLWSCVLKLMSVLHKVICAGIEFQRDAPAKEKLVLNRSVLGLSSIIERDEARLLWQIKRSLRYWGVRFRKALKTITTTLSLSLSLSLSFSLSVSAPLALSLCACATTTRRSFPLCHFVYLSSFTVL